MLPLPGYTISETLQEGTSTVVYRGRRERDQVPVLLKMCKVDHPSMEERIRLRHEFELTRDLHIDGVVRPYGLEQHGQTPVLVLEDRGDRPLKSGMVTTGVDPGRFLEVAIQVVHILERLHEVGIIHRDLKPDNLLIHPMTGAARLTGFTFAMRLPHATWGVYTAIRPEGTLAYMSPEQTGWMNRPIDYRTDFYALGVTFYELLSGRLPFHSIDPMTLVHARIVRDPPPLRDIIPDLPPLLNDIVMKLLAGAAEDRYQSASGLAADLEDCLARWLAGQAITDLVPGQRDRSDRFQISQKVYGREQEMAVLHELLSRVGRGVSEVLLVSGSAGVGKSTLVCELQQPVIQARGHFIVGAFDPVQRTSPYSAFIKAVQDLVRQLSVESEARIRYWREQLLAALGPNGQLIIDVVPDVERILGPQPPVVRLPPAEAQKRFPRVFLRFLQVFAQVEYPLVLFLDDLQWADAASLKFIELLEADARTHALFLIGAFRDDAVGWQHPLRAMLSTLSETGVQVHHMSVSPIDKQGVRQFLADTLRVPPSAVTSLAALVYAKTGGNPFLMRAFLHTLYMERLIVHNPVQGWEWNVDAIEPVQAAGDVVEWVLQRLERVPNDTRALVRLAACIGGRFDPAFLSDIAQQSAARIAADLEPALQEHLVVLVDTGYAFYHDRVREAAYGLIDDAEKQQIHARIGHRLLQQAGTPELSNNVFAIVDQFNIRQTIPTTPEAQVSLARLYLLAGQQARLTAAYDSAWQYLSAGLQLLGPEGWHTQYELALDLHVEATEVAFMTNDFVRSEDLARAVLQHAPRLIDRARVYETRVQAAVAQDRFDLAVEIGLAALRMLGVPLEAERAVRSFPFNLLAWRQMPAAAADQWGDTSAVVLPQLTDLETLSVMQAPEQLAAMRLLVALAQPVFETRPELFPRLIRTQIHYCTTYGYSSLAAVAYGLYGVMLIATQNRVAEAHQAGRLSLQLLDRFEDRQFVSRVSHMFHAHIRHWQEHAQTTIAPLREGIQYGLDTGDCTYAGYNARELCAYRFFIGEPLEEVVREQAHYLELVENLRQEPSMIALQVWYQVGLNLLGRGSETALLAGERFNAERVLPRLQAANDRMLLFMVHLGELVLAYWFQQYDLALEKARLAAPYVPFAAGLMHVGIYHVYHALALLAHYPAQSSDERGAAPAQVDLLLERMQAWSPANYQHARELIEAEKARVLGQTERAMEHYDRAIAAALTRHAHHMGGLAYELAGAFYLGLGRERVARVYLNDARDCYMVWGATARLRLLEAQYGSLLADGTIGAHRASDPAGRPAVDNRSVARTPADLDLKAVLKASQAISGEMDLAVLVDRLMRAVMEHAGAQKGMLILEKAGQLVVQAEGSVEHPEITRLQALPVEACQQLSAAIVYYVWRTGSSLMLADAQDDPRFAADVYVVQQQIRSVLCVPILHQGTLLGMVYLEHNRTPGAFTPDQIEVMQILSSQAAISLENARFYEEMKREMSERKRAEEALRSLTEGTATVTGEDFFRSLVRYVARTFDVQYAFVAETTDASAVRARTLAFLENDHFNDNIEYDLEGTPCQDVIEGNICYYPDRLHELFGGNEHLRSYLGIPLRNSAGEVQGHLAIFDNKPMERSSYDISILKIFSARAGVELERQQAEDALRRNEEALRQREAQLRQLNEQLADYNRNLEQRVTERTHEIERRRQLAERLRDMLAILNSDRSLEEILDYIVGEGIQLLGTGSGAIFRLDAEQSLFAVQAARGLPEAYVADLSFAAERSFLGQAVAQRRPIVVADITRVLQQREIDLPPHKKAILAQEYHTLLVAPLMQQSRSEEAHEIYGGLALYYPDMREFSEEELGLVITFADQATLAIENARLRQRVRQAAVVAERSRLARELHDSVTQSLYSLTLLAEGWRRMAEDGRLEQVVEPLAELGNIGQQALKEMRLLVHELRPPVLEKEGLLGALHQRLGAVERRAGVEARLLADADALNDLDAGLEEGLYRITQEALNNALKHAAATVVTVHIRVVAQRIELEVVDNGQGFDPLVVGQGGVGLQSMRERTERLGGTLQIDAAPGQGTRIMVTLPA